MTKPSWADHPLALALGIAGAIVGLIGFGILLNQLGSGDGPEAIQTNETSSGESGDVVPAGPSDSENTAATTDVEPDGDDEAATGSSTSTSAAVAIGDGSAATGADSNEDSEETTTRDSPTQTAGEVRQPSVEDSELLFYRSDNGLRHYYDVSSTGDLKQITREGSYNAGWTHLIPVEIDGDAGSELLFYRSDNGLRHYYDVSSTGDLKQITREGSYNAGWTHLIPVEIDGD